MFRIIVRVDGPDGSSRDVLAQELRDVRGVLTTLRAMTVGLDGAGAVGDVIRDLMAAKLGKTELSGWAVTPTPVEGASDLAFWQNMLPDEFGPSPTPPSTPA